MGNMQKRGQSSLFIVVAIIVVLVLSIGIYFKVNLKQMIQKETIIPQQVISIQDSIQVCVSSSLIGAVRLIGLQGGYTNPPASALKTNFSTIAYGYYEGRNVLANNKKIEVEISNYIETQLPKCLNTIPAGFSIKSKNPTVKTKISEKISATVDFPITVSKNNITFELNKKYYSNLNINIVKFLDQINTIINSEVKNPNYIDLTLILNSGYNSAILPYNSQTIIYSITDTNTTIENIPFTFMYAKKIR